MRTRKPHILQAQTIEAVRSRLKGGGLRRLAVELGFPVSYNATLADVLKAKPGALTLDGENMLRLALGLPAIGSKECPFVAPAAKRT